MSSLHHYYPFDYPSQQQRPEQAASIGVYANNWINDVLPYSGNSAYRVHEAMWRGGGNCYAQALGTMALLSHWGVDNGLVLDEYHAKVVMQHDDEIWFVDPGDAVFNPKGEAEVKRRDDSGTLAQLYEATVETVLSGAGTEYYFVEPAANSNLTWKSMPLKSVPKGETAGHMNRHIIAQHSEAEDILHAIGDLLRFDATDRSLYLERFNELEPYVPATIGLSKLSHIPTQAPAHV